MAQQTNNNSTKRGPGRPPGSKNKPKNTANPTKQEVLDEMKRRSDREKRNNDVIWSITLIAIALFLFFTVVMDTTGSFGRTIHDIFNGIFGKMAYVLPFLVLIFALLLLGGKLSHINTRTAIFSVLIFVNMCVINSYRYIDSGDIRCGFKDIVDFYIYGVDGKKGGALGMEVGSILAKLFGMPGLLIISITVLIISVFMVANSPISRLAGTIGAKREHNRILREIEEDEKRRLTDDQIKAAIQADPSITAPAEEKKPFWKSIISGIIREDEPEAVKAPETQAPTPSVDDIPKPFSGKAAARADNLDYTQIIKTPETGKDKQLSRGTLFGKMKGFFAGIDSETGENITQEKLKDPEPSDKVGLNGNKNAPRNVYSDSRNFDADNEDFGYPGRKRTAAKPAAKTGMGLGDPDEIVHSGSYGLDGHDRSGAKIKTTGLEPAATSTTAAAATGRETSKPKQAAVPKPAAPKQEVPKAEEPSPDDAAIAAGFNAVADDMAYELPPVSLLKKDTGSKQLMNDAQLQARAELLEQTLNDFGVDARVLKVTQGASVTRYEVQPATGVKVASITRLSDDIALNLRAKSIRIEAPIPGKAAVGIEVENDKPAPVLIRELIDSDEFREADSIIEFVVGKDISGNNIVADLTDMPHLLIAGATGSGKSVCINSIVTSFLYKARPSELKLIMIDPKVVELGNYNGIPHMLTPVVTDPRKASRALAIAVEEMDKRYELFAENNVKDLKSYNELMRADQRYADCKPQIVIIIDELADLMMASPSEVENSICRLAQKARAAGMHLIVATQRPSVDVVTGLIKANIPSRIAFSVASQFDSRTILDMAGAEKLLGKGDMLFSPVGSTKPYRVQGPYISEKEIDRVIKFVKKEGGNPDYDEELKSAIENADKRSSKEPQDELTEDAIAFIFKSKQASVSMLQRRFRIGYNRAARIIDEIEEKGIIGPSDGSRPRQLLITEEEYYGGYEAESEPEPEPAPQPAPVKVRKPEPEPEPEPVYVPETVNEPEYEMAPEDDGIKPSSGLSTTKAMDSFNSLPESVRRMIMDADSESDY
ncbi:MAG: DNA translocase FtsK [Mogibacterium sp.]|nr:DNA translocase FtsK [Mogibacterium sp.]